MLALNFRNDINILRALAVTLVVVFHLYPNTFQQGFLGVDIFFVISGYLITSKIFHINNYNLRMWLHFMLGRLKRIYPILVVTLILSLFFFSHLFSPSEQLSLIESAYSSFFSVANIYFWRDGGYFGGNDKLKPLLHFWSLAIEMQFYFIFSVIMFIFCRFMNNYFLLYCIVIITLLSFILNFYFYSIGGQNPAFFLLPTRFWQFGLGALAAYLRYHKVDLSLLNHMFWTVLAIIAFLYVLFSDLVSPTSNLIISLCLFIIIIQELNFFNFVSRHVFFLDYIGRISFPVYCVHWPLIVAANYYFIDRKHIIIELAILLTTVVMSGLLHEWVEKKSRHAYALPLSCLIGLFILLSPSKIWINEKNLDERYVYIAEQVGTHYRCSVNEYVAYGSSRACRLGSENIEEYIALLGNSHAQMYAPVLLAAYTARRKGVLLIPLNNCLPTISVNLSEECQSQAKVNYNALISDENISHVVIATTWQDRVYFNKATNSMDGDLNDVVNDLKDMIHKLRISGRRVSLVGPLMVPGFDFASIVSRKIRFENLREESYDRIRAIPHGQLYERYFNITAEFKNLLGEDYIDVLSEFCDAKYCYLADDESTFFADKSHIGAYGRDRLANVFLEFVDKAK